MLDRLRMLILGLGAVGFSLALLLHGAIRLWPALTVPQVVWLSDQILPAGVAVGLLFVIALLLSLPSSYEGVGSRRALWKRVTRYAPLWMRLLLTGLIVYVAITVVVQIVTVGNGGPAIDNGVYVVKLRGQVLREISEAEYLTLSRQWISFVGLALGVIELAAMTALMSKLNEPENPEPMMPENIQI